MFGYGAYTVLLASLVFADRFRLGNIDLVDEDDLSAGWKWTIGALIFPPIVVLYLLRRQEALDESRTSAWVFLAVVIVLIALAVFGIFFKKSDETPAPVANKPVVTRPKVAKVEYNVTGTAIGANITYTVNGGGTQTQQSVKVPFVKQDTKDLGPIVYTLSVGNIPKITATSISPKGTLTCTITVAGVKVAEESTSPKNGKPATVTCTGIPIVASQIFVPVTPGASPSASKTPSPSATATPPQ